VSGRARAEVVALSTCSGRPACAKKVIDFSCAFDDRFSIALRGLGFCTRIGKLRASNSAMVGTWRPNSHRTCARLGRPRLSIQSGRWLAHEKF